MRLAELGDNPDNVNGRPAGSACERIRAGFGRVGEDGTDVGEVGTDVVEKGELGAGEEGKGEVMRGIGEDKRGEKAKAED